MNDDCPSRTDHTIRLVSLAVAASLLGAPTVGHAQSGASGFTPGVVDVGPSGSAAINVPIHVAPGIHGLQPQLALRYDSGNARNGLAGLGFSIAGLSQIHRCAKHAPTYGERSRAGTRGLRLCIDGLPLLRETGGSTSDGTYWGASYYRTEEETGVRVRRRGGDCQHGTCYFDVSRPDGSVARYGRNGGDGVESMVSGFGSSITGSGNTTQAWLIRRVTDRHGNRMEFDYELDMNHNYPSRISYGPRTVDFVYENRTEEMDINRSFFPAFGRVQRRRLSRIDAAVDGQIFKSYRLSYAHTDRSADRPGPSQLTEVRECDGGGTCHEPLVMNWLSRTPNDSLRLYSTQATPGFPNNNPTDKDVTHLGDFDGRGRSGVIVRYGSSTAPYLGSQLYRYVRLGYWGEAGFEALPIGSSTLRSRLERKNTRVVTGDFNGDGLTDILTQRNKSTSNTVELHTSRGGGAFTTTAVPQMSSKYHTVDNVMIHTGDFNGDGLTDFLRQERGDVDNDIRSSFQVYLSDGSGGFQVHTPGANQAGDHYQDHLRFDLGYRVIPTDHNGDGLTDFLAINVQQRAAPGNRYLRVFLSNGDGSFTLAGPSGRIQFRGQYINIIPGDFNGDGKMDLLRQEKDAWANDTFLMFNVYFSRGDGSFVERRLPEPYQRSGFSGSAGAVLVPGDFNGDGVTDFARYETGNYATNEIDSFSIFYSLGNGEFQKVSMTDSDYQFHMRHTRIDLSAADFNGDGQTDLMSRPKYSSTQALRMHAPQSQKYSNHLIAEVRTGDGRVRDIRYAALGRGGKNAPGAAYVHADVPSGADGRLRPLSGGLWLVDRLDEYRAGARSSTTQRKTFEYEGLVVGRAGIGMIGFQKMTTTDHAQGTVREQRVNIEPSLRGRLISDTLETLGGEVLTRRTYHWTKWAADTLVGNHFVRVTRRVDESFEGGAVAISITRDFAYDAHGNEIWEARTEGSTPALSTCRSFDLTNQSGWHRGRLLEQTQATSGCSLDAAAGTCSCAGAPLSRKTFIYDGDGNVLQERDYDDQSGAWEVTTLTYDGHGNVSSSTDPAGVRTIFGYGPHHTHPARMVVDPSGAALETTLVFDPRFGEKALERGPNGAALITVFDGFGRPSARRLEAIGVRANDTWACLSSASSCGSAPARETLETYQYGTNRIEHRKYDAGQLIAHTRTHLDHFGREERREIVASQGRVLTQTYAYDSEGRVVRESEPYAPGETAVFSETAYDERGRPTSMAALNGSLASFDYEISALCSANELAVHAAVASGGVTRRSVECRDFRGKVTRRRTGDQSGTAGAGPEQSFVYDALGRLVRTYSADTSSPGANLETTYVYDSLGRRVRVMNDARGQQDLRYAQGRLERRTQGSETWTYEYDSAGRHTAAVLPDGARREIHYDGSAPFGRGQAARMQMVRPGGAVESARTYSYDAFGHLMGETLEVSGRTFAMGYSHRSDGELAQVTYPDGSQLNISHDQAGNMTALDVEETENGQTFSTRYVGLSSYSALGQPGQLEFSNGVTTRYDYDGIGRLARVRTSSQSGDFVDKSYTWNGFGEVAQIADALRASFSQTFSFDDVGHLTRAEGAYGVRTYRYDVHGNLTDKAGTQLTYRGDRLLSASTGDTFEYDVRGNRTAKHTAQGTLRYRYSGLDQLKEVVREVRGASCSEDRSVPCADTTLTVLDSNVYDANGARIMKTDRNGAVSIYVSPLYEVTTFPNGTELHTRYLNGPAGRIVSLTDEVAPSGAGSQTALGSPFLPRRTLQLALIALCLSLAFALAWSWLRAAGRAPCPVGGEGSLSRCFGPLASSVRTPRSSGAPRAVRSSCGDVGGWLPLHPWWRSTWPLR